MQVNENLQHHAGRTARDPVARPFPEARSVPDGELLAALQARGQAAPS